MDKLDELVRGELLRLTRAPLPDADGMLRRVHRRRTVRRGMAAAVALVVLVLAAVAVVRVVRTPAPVTGRPAGVVEELDVSFATESTGYAAAGLCPPEPAACEVWVARTGDAGRSWTWRRVAGLGFDRDGGVVLFLRVLSPTAVVVRDRLSDSFQWYSGDGGRTWAPVALAPTDTVAEAAAGAPVEIAPAAGPPLGPRVPLLTQRTDGTWARLATQPDLDRMQSTGEVTEGRDGSRWLVAADEASAHLFVSRDQGRSWGEATVPDPAVLLNWRIEPGDGRTLYATVSETNRVWRSVDGALTWQPVESPVSILDVVALPDGSAVLLGPDGPPYAVSRSGTRFEPWQGTGLSHISHAGARYVGYTATALDGPDRSSVDGRTWTEVHW